MCICILWDFISYRITLSVNRDNLTFSFQSWTVFISFSCLISLAGTSTTMFSSSDESGKPHLFPILGETLQSFRIEYEDSCEFFINAFYHVEEASCYS